MQNVAARVTAADDVRWTKCPSCDAFIYHKRLERNLRVCPECNYHFRLSIAERLAQLLDPGTFEDMSHDIEPMDVLSFVDSKPYTGRILDAQRKSGRRDGGLYGTAQIGGQPVVVAGMDFAFMGGSMGSAMGEAITRGAELALSTRTPFLMISASGGARMQEGCISLMQMVKTSQALARLDEEGILYISLLTDPTYGGVSASFASLGDVHIAEPGTLVGFAGPQVIQQTIRQELPAGFQTAEFLMEHGMLDLIEPRENIRHTIAKLLELHAQRSYPASDSADSMPAPEGKPPITDADDLPDGVPWEIVQLARNIDRPTTLEYIAHIFDDFVGAARRPPV